MINQYLFKSVMNPILNTIEIGYGHPDLVLLVRGGRGEIDTAAYVWGMVEDKI